MAGGRAFDERTPIAGGPGAGKTSPLLRLTGLVAVLGGLLALSVALLVAASVLGRWLFSAPIDGDFEFVKMATAVAVFAWLPYAQARRANIVVDTFTLGLAERRRRRLDAFWDLCYAGFIGFLAVALTNGTLDAIRSGETTMQRQLLIWPSIALAAALALLLAVTSVLTALALLRRPAEPQP
jgi:TRAP-type C4-dicarboxylate transport system permease small subunit